MPTPGTSNNQQTFTSILSRLQFSQPAGFYDTAIELLLSHDDPGVNVRFTTNGSEPSESDPIFQGPIQDSSDASSQGKGLQGRLLAQFG